MKKSSSLGYAFVFSVFAMGLATLSHAGDPKAEKEYKHSYCKQGDAQCGVVAYLNSGGYTVEWVKLSAKGSKKQVDNYNTECKGIEKKIKSDLTAGEFHQFTVPATCRYKLKIKIKSGETKDKGLTLTPGCIIVAKSAGTTTLNNKIKKKSISFVDDLPDEVKDFGKANCKI